MAVGAEFFGRFFFSFFEVEGQDRVSLFRFSFSLFFPREPALSFLSARAPSHPLFLRASFAHEILSQQ